MQIAHSRVYNMPQLIQMIYISSSSQLMNESELQELLTIARKRNHHHNISGLLLYHDGSIMQAIEGEEAAVRQLMFNIERDSRHTGILILLDEKIDQRSFPDWKMSYRHITTENNEGLSDFLFCQSSSHEKEITAGRAKKLITSFRGVL